ncbi:MAG: putative 2-dehydropantoate 2-reductase [Oscillatoriales cyanobacterium]|nr:MAG: putative 2-dehydropantoate 2-reductase [Oscillatoriales cyanobacterium]
MTKRSYAILGTGAIGGLYGARLHAAGFPVRFLLHRDYQQVRDRGLRVDSIWGDLHLHDLEIYNDVADMPPADVTIVALKTTQNSALPKLLPPLVGDRGLVLVLQNGLGVEADIARMIGDRVLGGLCFTCSNKIAPGHIHHLDEGKIALGDFRLDGQPSGLTDRLEAIAGDLEQAGIPIERQADLILARWKKLMWNIPFNGLSAILDAKTDALVADPAIRTLAVELMQEIRAVAAADQRFIPADFINTMLTTTDAMRPYLTSMKLDLDHNRPLELDAIFGHPLRVAQAYGVAMPQTLTLYRQLKFLNDRRSRETPV